MSAHRSFRSMATDVHLQVVTPTSSAAAALDRAETVIAQVARSCTRFEPTSALMQANAAPRRWHEVPDEVYAAVREAHAAYQATGGLFDPRVLRTLEAWGYDRSLPFRDGAVSVPEPPSVRASQSASGPSGRRARRRTWRPRFDDARGAVRIGGAPLDLGGIAKGLAVRWAAEKLSGAGTACLVEAGGDLFAAGPGPEGAGWRVAVEDPRGGDEPVAVLNLIDQACASSSVRLRRWRVGGRPVHHLIDPRTGDAADSGLLSVTVVGPDPAQAEVWSKTLFLHGRGRVRQVADEHGIAALLVDEDGVVGVSSAMRAHVMWQVPRGW